jgi:hypothetical protein
MHYEVSGYQSYRIDPKDGPQLMANFVARITKEVRITDGMRTDTVLTVEGEMPPPKEKRHDHKAEATKLPPVEVGTEEFNSMSWVVREWGVRCVIVPGSGVKDDLRAMIQSQSEPEVTTIYRHTGWQEVPGKGRCYLHCGGAITADGNDPTVQVRMPNELNRYDLSDGAKVKPAEAIRATLQLLELTTPEVVWPLIGCTLAPLFGPVDFACHVTGRTGTFKSELMSLFQSHYGPGMDSRHLPGSWSSTVNAIEALAYLAANAPFVLDDFVPQGTSYAVRQLQGNADRIIRAQGNQAGRARLTDTSNMQATMYPRGVILSTGEDTPEGHSVRARMLILELSPGDIEPPKLTAAQARRSLYPGTVAWLARRLARKPVDLTERTNELRAAYRQIGHSRTPGMLGRIRATCEAFLAAAQEDGVITPATHKRLRSNAAAAIESAGARQVTYLENADPVEMFLLAIRRTVATGAGHFRSLNGGVPRDAVELGWSAEAAVGEMNTYKSRGQTIGWVNSAKDEMFLDMTGGYPIVKKAMPDMSLTQQTLLKRLKDAGALIRVDDGRQRNTIRVTAENHPRNVVALSLSSTMELKEVADSEDEG